MKTLQVCPRYYPDIGGVETRVQNMSEMLAREHDVTVFTTDSTGRLPKDEWINGVLVRRFKGYAPNNAYYVSLAMLRELRRAEFDVVHGHNYHALPLYLCRYARRRRFVVTPSYHGLGHTPFRNLVFNVYRRLGARIFRDADKIIALSCHERELLLKDFQIDEAKIEMIPNGLDLEEFQSLTREGKERTRGTILCVGRLEEYKGIQHVIRTLPLLDSDFRLQIVGKGSYKDELVKLVDTLALDTRVEFFQDLPRTELLEKYAAAGVFVSLSQAEAFGNAVAEALAAKTPCIVATTAALKEWVDNENCLGIDYPVDINKLAQLIEKATSIEVRVRKLWSWQEVARRTASVYEELL